MLRHLCGPLAWTIILIYSIIHFLSFNNTIKTFIIRAPAKREPDVPLTPMLSAGAKFSQIMDKLLVWEKIQKLDNDEKLFLNQYMVSEMAKDFSRGLKEKMNAVVNDKGDAKLFSMDTEDGSRSVVLSFRGMSDAQQTNATIEMQKAFALQLGLIHWKKVNVSWSIMNGKNDVTRRLLGLLDQVGTVRWGPTMYGG